MQLCMFWYHSWVLGKLPLRKLPSRWFPPDNSHPDNSHPGYSNPENSNKYGSHLNNIQPGTFPLIMFAIKIIPMCCFPTDNEMKVAWGHKHKVFKAILCNQYSLWTVF